MIKDPKNIEIQFNMEVSSIVRTPIQYMYTITKHRRIKTAKTTV